MLLRRAQHSPNATTHEPEHEMNITQAHEVAVKSLKAEPDAAAVTVEFTVASTGLTKFLRVHRSDMVEVFNTSDEAEA